MWIEIQRLYLDYRKEDDKYKIVLSAMSEDAAPKNDYNLFQNRSILLAKLDGTPLKYTRVNLNKKRKMPLTGEEKEAIDVYKEKCGVPPPPVFDTLEMIFHVIDDDDFIQKLEL